MRSLRALLPRIVDYAGLFPPAKLDMPRAAANYANYLKTEHEWMLGRFILPVARLNEFEQAVGGLKGALRDAPPPDHHQDLWRLAALTAPASEHTFENDLETILTFNDAHDPDTASLEGAPAPFPCVIDTIEVKATTSAAIDAAISVMPEGLLAFFEIPIHEDPRGHIAALAGEEGMGAKVRTGGVTPDAFPNPDHLARFIHICAAAGVPFKATAGLHHPLRNEFNLTYDPNPPRGTMFGFLNVFLAAAFIYTERMPPEVAATLLTETSPTAFKFEDGGVRWRSSAAGSREWSVPSASLARTREQFAISFGSCSFEEPVADLQALKLL